MDLVGFIGKQVVDTFLKAEKPGERGEEMRLLECRHCACCVEDRTCKDFIFIIFKIMMKCLMQISLLLDAHYELT